MPVPWDPHQDPKDRQDVLGSNWSGSADSFVGVSGTIGSASKIVSPDKIGDHIEDLFKIDSIATEKLRERISREVKDQETAEKLKPWYGTWCKRPTFHDDYLPTFNHENVPLVDTDGEGLESLTEKASSLMESRRNGVSFTTAWEKPGSMTAFGVFLPGFPNFAAAFYRGGGFSYNLSSVYDVFARPLCACCGDSAPPAEQ
ncbi:hypothetical protein LA080_012040 [Diaporthe eres]|nr:hypothetical protein LA080_012040 [Diaporthe eres]